MVWFTISFYNPSKYYIYIFIPSLIFSNYNIFPLFMSMLLKVVRISKMHFFLNSTLASSIFCLDMVVWESNVSSSQSQCLAKHVHSLLASLLLWLIFVHLSDCRWNKCPFFRETCHTNPRCRLGSPVIRIASNTITSSQITFFLINTKWYNCLLTCKWPISGL